MATVPLLHVRWSAIKTWRRCHKQYEYAFVQRIEKRKPSVPLIRGTILGECLDELAEKKTFEPVLAGYEKKYSKLFQAEKDEYGDLIGECRRIVENYKTLYAKDGLKYLAGPNGEHHEINVETRLEVDGTRVKFTGHLDKLPQDKNGRIWVMDHKSHRTIPDESQRYNDLQLVTYLWLLPESGLPKANGVIWDYLRTKPPTVPEVLKNGSLTTRQNLDTDYDTYLKAIKDNGLDPRDYKERLGSLEKIGSNNYLQRIFLPSPPKAMIDNMVADFKQTIIELRDCTKRGTFTRSMTRDCNFCGYYNLCQAELRGLDSSFIRKAEYQPSTRE